MDTIETKRYEMLVRLNEFGKEHGDLFPETSESGKHFAQIAEAVEQLSGYAVEKMRAVDEARTRKGAERRRLRARLRAINRTARLIAPDHPGMEDAFNLPDPETDQTMITAGRMFTENAAAFSAAFIGQGMAPTFVADLQALVDGFEQALKDRSAGADAHALARTNIAQALAAGTAAAQKLDAMVANHLLDNEPMVALWKRDRTVGHPRRQRTGRTKASEAPASGTVAAEPSGDQKVTSDSKVA